MLIVREYVRYHMINNCNQKRILSWRQFISLMFVAVDLNIYKFDTYFETSLTTLEFIIETLLPGIVTNLYLTYICYFVSHIDLNVLLCHNLHNWHINLNH